jgi:uncharacterized protein YfaS (alpha-2-macroglobulin family)
MPPRFFSEIETVPVSALPKGVYLVEATDGELRAYTIIVVSEMGLITKVAPGQILAFASDRRSGAPVSDADVRVWFDKNEHTHLQSDADGLVESPLASGKYEDVRVLAVHGDDVALVTPYSYSLSSDPSQDWTGYVYSDRPVYRPGDTVHFKAILRTRSGEILKVPAGRQSRPCVILQRPRLLLLSRKFFAEQGIRLKYTAWAHFRQPKTSLPA